MRFPGRGLDRCVQSLRADRRAGRRSRLWRSRARRRARAAVARDVRGARDEEQERGGAEEANEQQRRPEVAFDLKVRESGIARAPQFAVGRRELGAEAVVTARSSALACSTPIAGFNRNRRAD